MIVYSIGCSHTYGHCLENKELVWSNLVMSRFESNYPLFGTNLTKLTPSSIKDIDTFYVNESVCGAGNDYIYHQTLESVTSLIDNNKKPDYVFIQWSGPNRREDCSPDGNIRYVNLHDNVDRGIKFEPMGSKHTLHYMYSLQEFLKNENIEYRFFNYMGLDRSIQSLSVYNKLDFNNILDFGFGNDILFTGILDYIVKNNLSCDDLGHPNERGNYFIASELLKKIGFTKSI